MIRRMSKGWDNDSLEENDRGIEIMISTHGYSNERDHRNWFVELIRNVLDDQIKPKDNAHSTTFSLSFHT